MLKLTFLGTSAGVPTKQRNVSALAVECLGFSNKDNHQSHKSKANWILIDCGEGTQHQLLHTNLMLNKLAVICITHVHGDHCYGLPGLLASMAMAGRQDKLILIAPKAIGKLLDTLSITTELYFTYPIEFMAIEDILVSPNLAAVTQKTDNKCPNIDSSAINNVAAYPEQTNSKNIKTDAKSHIPQAVQLELTRGHMLTIGITALSHRVPSYAFVIKEQLSKNILNTQKLMAENIPKGAAWGQLQNGYDVTLPNASDQNQSIILKSKDYMSQQHMTIKLVVAGDNDAPELLEAVLKDATLLVHEGTYQDKVLQKIQNNLTKDTQAVDPMHSSVGAVARFAQRIQLPYLILTHFSARYQNFDNVADKTANMGHLKQEVNKYYKGVFWLANDFDQFEVTEQVAKVIPVSRK